MTMANMHTRIERSSDRLVMTGLRLKEILADGRIDDVELAELPDIAEALLNEAVEVEDVAADIACAKQMLTLGRQQAPNRPLTERIRRVDMLREMHEAKKKAPKRVAFAGSRVAG